MSIPVFSAGPLRKQIGFVRDLPDEARDVLEKRGYTCYEMDEAALHKPGQLSTTDSVILTQTQGQPYKVWQDLERYAHLLNHDCRLYVRYTPDTEQKNFVLHTLNSLKLPPCGLSKTDTKLISGDWFEGANASIFAPFVYILEASNDWDSLANLIASNPAGQPPSTSLNIEICNAEHKPFTLPDEDELLLKRAFWNCSSVKLVAKVNGLSKVDAYDVFAHLADNVVGGGWPYRYFVKLGDRVKVAREYDKYRTTALENVPYHLGPRLRMDRCMLGWSRGLIVSDYVAGAEALRDCVRDSRGIPAIGNLFNQTLIAWRRAATMENRPLQQILIDNYLPQEIPKHRDPLIRGYGATKTLEELKALIENTSQSQPVLTGVIHGDLHATNVLVRMGDAVIIDLERVSESKPLLYDAASLEGGLFVDGFINDRRPAVDVLDSLQFLYTSEAFDRDDHHCHPGNESAWFLDCVRQIRMQARQMELQSRQYGLTLAVVLLKKACNDEDFRSKDLREKDEIQAPDVTPLTRESVRALAYVLAERILVELSK